MQKTKAWSIVIWSGIMQCITQQSKSQVECASRSHGRGGECTRSVDRSSRRMTFTDGVHRLFRMTRPQLSAGADHQSLPIAYRRLTAKAMCPCVKLLFGVLIKQSSE
jgi:hypothetical protein